MASSQVCEGCVKPGDAQAPVAHTGTETQVGGHDTYVVGQGDKALVICTDIYGWRFSNVRGLAEQYAAACGIAVYIPRYLIEGSEATPENKAQFMANFVQWLQQNPLAHNAEVTKAVCEAIAPKHPKGVVVAGFCLGAKAVVDTLNSGVAQAGLLFHPSFLTAEDATALRQRNVPLQFHCAETDSIFVPELRAKFEAALKDAANVQFLDYPATTHGFASRPHGPEEQAAMDKAHLAAIEFVKAL